jgi:hypothetical protein
VDLVKLPHPPDIRRRKAGHTRELAPQVGREPFHHGITPTLRGLLFNDGPAQIPIEQHQVPVDRAGGRSAGRQDPFLQLGHKEPVTVV